MIRLFHSLRFSASKEVQVLCRYVARDVQTVTGKNLKLLKDITGMDPWTTSNGRLKEALVGAELVEVPERDRWRLPYLGSLLAQRGEANYSAMEEDVTRLGQLISSLVTN